MKLKIATLFLFIGLSSIAQSTFKQGYFIKNNAIKNEGFFMSYGTHLPEEINFKENQGAIETTLLKVSELAELNMKDVKFLRKQVQVELLDKNMSAKNGNNTIPFSLEVKNLFLKVLLEFNNFTLYAYHLKGNDYFFIETNEGIEFLKYKKITKNNKQLEIKDFRRQLLEKYKIITPINQGLIGHVNYKEKDLMNYFIKYAKQSNFVYKEYISYFIRDFKDAFNITPKIGYSFSTQTIKTETNNYESSFNESQISFGLDLEYFFNTKVKKSSLILSYMYHSKRNSEYKFGLAQDDDSEVFNTTEMNNIHIMYRRYFKLFNKQFLYANIGVLMHKVNGKTEYVFIPTGNTYADLRYNHKNNNIGLSLGVGYNFKNIYLDLNYNPKIKGSFNAVNIVSDNWQYERSMFNVSVGYSVF